MADRTIYVVTSDEAHNGKSLFARLLIDYLLLAGRDPIVFDAGWPHQRLKERWPLRALSADFSKVQGQMVFFDGVLAAPPRDGVLDLSWRDLEMFLSVAEDIQFSREMAAKGMGLDLFFVLAPTADSRRLVQRIKAMNLFHAIHSLRPQPDSTGHSGVVGPKDIKIPRLSPSVVARIERPAFSIESFMRGRDLGLSELEVRELNDFLDKVMGAIDEAVTRGR